MPSLMQWSAPFASASAVALACSSAVISSFAPSQGVVPAEAEDQGAHLLLVPLYLGGSEALPSEELTPPRRGLGKADIQSSKILVANHSHIGGGYAAVGEVLKPPDSFFPMVFW